MKTKNYLFKAAVIASIAAVALVLVGCSKSNDALLDEMENTFKEIVSAKESGDIDKVYRLEEKADKLTAQIAERENTMTEAQLQRIFNIAAKYTFGDDGVGIDETNEKTKAQEIAALIEPLKNARAEDLPPNPTEDFDVYFNETLNGINLAVYKVSSPTVVVPAEIEGLPVRSVKFDGSNETILAVVLPNSITAIGEYAFYRCTSLVFVNIPVSVTSIGYEAFYGCKNLASIIIPNSVVSISKEAFYGCSKLESVNIPDSVTSIGDSAFMDCVSLQSATISESVTSIGKYAFGDCNQLTAVNIPNKITAISEGMFLSCGQLASINIPDGITSIGDSAFAGCESLVSITIPASVTSIGDAAFAECRGFRGLPTIPAGVTSISRRLFGGCDGLVSATIPDNITTIDAMAFYGCENLASVEIPASVISIGDRAFAECPNLTSVSVADGAHITFSRPSPIFGTSNLDVKSQLALKKAGY